MRMKAFLSRAASIVLLTLAVFAGTRALVRALPGDPLETLMAESGTSLSAEALNRSLHLNEPYWKGLGEDLARAAHGDLGISIISRRPVAPLLARGLGRTAALAGLSLAISLALSIVIGLPAAQWASGSGGGLSRTADFICTLYGTLIAAMPTAWLGPILILALGVWIPVFPVGGHLLLPALTLALGYSGLWARLIRARAKEELVRGAAIGARARGVPEWKVLLKYGLAPVSGALMAYLGTQAGALLGGALVTEVVFDWRGLGSLLVEAVLRRDYPLVEGAAFVTAVMALCGTALGDWLQSRIDPRLER